MSNKPSSRIIRLELTPNLRIIIIPPGHPRAINTAEGQRALLDMFNWVGKAQKKKDARA